MQIECIDRVFGIRQGLPMPFPVKPIFLDNRTEQIIIHSSLALVLELADRHG